MMATGIVLNGASSSGKTTVARALQLQLADAGIPYLYLGLDDFFDLVPARFAQDVPALEPVALAFNRLRYMNE